MTFAVFPAQKITGNKRIIKSLAIYTPFVMLLTLTPFIFELNKAGQPSPRPAIVLFTLLVIITLGGGIFNVIKKYRQAEGKLRDQLRLISYGLGISFGLIFLGNFVLVAALNYTGFLTFTPLFTLIFSSAFTYAIVRHNLFDVRKAAALSLTYILLVATIAGVYSLILFGIINVVFAGPEREFLRQLLTVILVVPLAIGFQKTKQFFDKITNQLFYHEAYDTQDVLDELGNIAASEINLDGLLRNTRRTLSDALKSSFIEFILLRNDKPYLEAPTLKSVTNGTLLAGSQIQTQHKDLIMVEEVPNTQALRTQFIESGVAISLRLKTRKQIVGFILFGNKRSGDIYSEQDKKLLLIVANELAVAVQNALRFEEIENFNLTLQAKVEHATRQLRHANEKLKELDESKDDFISMASHQLRTPLTSVKGYLSMVLDGDAGSVNKTERKMLNQAYVSSQRMVYLIADLLNVSRLKTGKFVVEAAPVNLATMIDEEIDQLKESTANRDLTLIYDKPPHFPDVMLDETKTRQVVMNFIDNAVYYTPAGGTIRIELTDKPQTIELLVKDSGIGVPKTEQHHLFTKFYRAGNARRQRPDGTGLGLFMAKKVILAEGGSILFDSVEGKGSTFGFTFSKQKVAVPSARPVVSAASQSALAPR